jgi:delta8-fatty-acid desaturase
VYKLNSWLDRHPGGELAILHFVGRDATDEIEAYHPEHVIKQMRPFIVGQLTPDQWDDEKSSGVGWKPLNPPIQIGLWPMPRIHDIHLNTLAENQELIGSKSDTLFDHTLYSPPSLSDSWKKISPIDHASSSTSTTLDERLRALEPAQDPPDEALKEGYDLSLARQKHLSASYRVLHQKIRAAGLYRAPRPFYGYGPDLIRYSVLFLAFFLTHPAFPLLKNYLAGFLLDPMDIPAVETPSTLCCFISAVFLGLWWHQITFVAHDAGHSGITGHWLTDRLIGILIGNFLGGISIGWWCDVSLSFSLTPVLSMYILIPFPLVRGVFFFGRIMMSTTL